MSAHTFENKFTEANHWFGFVFISLINLDRCYFLLFNRRCTSGISSVSSKINFDE